MTLAETQADIALKRKAVRDKRDEIRGVDYEISVKQAELDALLRAADPAGPPDPAIEELRDDIDQLNEDRAELIEGLDGLESDAHAALTAFVSSLPGDLTLFDATLELNRSVALFPVRIETNFRPDGANVQLLVRVYPDDIHVESHEPALTDAEIAAAEAFWTVATNRDTVIAAANNPTEDTSAVRQAWADLLVDLGGPERAAYVTRVTDPQTPPLPAPARKSAEWQRRPEARILPDCWVVLGFREGEDTPAFNVRGLPIPDPLPVAPLSPLEKVEAGTASEMFDEETRWLIDFDEAVGVGMGIRIDLGPPPVEKIGILMVLGIKASLQSVEADPGNPDHDTSLRRLRDLFFGHRFTSGLAILPDGTPTNSGDADRSAYTERPAADAAFNVEFQGEVPPSERIDAQGNARLTDADHVQRAFGMSTDVASTSGLEEPFHEVENGHGRQDEHARAVNFVLWRSTLGYYLDQLMNEITGPEAQGGVGPLVWLGHTNQIFGASSIPNPRFNYAKNMYGRRHFRDRVRSGSSVPAFRVGNQPYGMLPITSFDAWEPLALPNGGDSSQTPWRPTSTEHGWPTAQWDRAIVDFLIKLRDEYWADGPANVTTVANSIAYEREAILKLIAWSSTSQRIAAEHFESLQHRAVWSWAAGDVWVEGATQPVDWHRDGIGGQGGTHAALKKLGLYDLGWRPRVRDLVLRALPVSANAPIVYDGPLSQTLTLTDSVDDAAKDYLTWLTEYRIGHWRDVDKEQNSHYQGAPSGVPLLYSMLRHAYLLEMAWHPLAYGGNSAGATLFRAPFFWQQPDVLAEPPNWKEVIAGTFAGFNLYGTVGPRFGFGDGGSLQTVPGYLPLLHAPLFFDPPGNVFDTDGNPGPTVGDYLEHIRQAGPAGALPLEAWNETNSNGHHLHPSFFEFFDRLAQLKQVPTAALDRNTRGVIDLASHRLDAWFTSYAFKRHEESRDQLTATSKPLAPHIGGYGWVENLEMRPASSDPQAPTARSLGYAFAPSPAQATTAAILRAAQIAHSRDAATENLLGVNLSSLRVRLAKYLLDGVRQGQPLPALLGYRFERTLHEISQQPGQPELDQFILPLRELFPLVAKQLPDPEVPPEETVHTGPIENLAAGNVVDGLALARAARTSSIPWGTAGLPGNPSPEKTAIERAIAELERAIDAVADVALAESVHQGVLGNPPRQGGVFGALNRGEGPSPELEVLATPRSGEALTHRLVVVLQDDALPDGWAQTPRAFAEPRLNTWAGKHLGAPNEIHCRVDFVDPTTGAPGTTESRLVDLGMLGVAPLDVIYDAVAGLAPAESVLGQRVLSWVFDEELGIGEDVVLVFDLSDTSTPALGTDFDTLLTVADALRKLIGSSRALRADETSLGNDAADPNLPPTGAGPDVNELAERVSAPPPEPNPGARERLEAVRATLSANPPEALEAVRDALQTAANFGITSALPGLIRPSGAPDPASDPAGYAAAVEEAVRTLAAATLPEVERRLDALDALDAGFVDGAETTDADRVAHQLKRMQLLLGEDFRASVSVAPLNAEELALAASSETSARIQRGDPRAVVTWLQRQTRVRPAVQTFGDAMLFLEAAGGKDPLDLRVAQIPFIAEDPSGPNEAWVGLNFEGQGPPNGDRLSLVLQDAAEVDFGDKIAGLVIDEWVEVVPGEQATAALTFHYDTPGARPGNAVLLASPPRQLGSLPIFQPWTFADLYRAVLETRTLAQLRMVDLNHIGIANHTELFTYLPATYHTHVTAMEGANTGPDVTSAFEISSPFVRNVKQEDAG